MDDIKLTLSKDPKKRAPDIQSEATWLNTEGVASSPFSHKGFRGFRYVRREEKAAFEGAFEKGKVGASRRDHKSLNNALSESGG